MTLTNSINERRDVYMNAKQQTIFYAGARDIRVIAARRFGKTDGTIGPQMWRVAQSMPRGGGIIGGNSRKQLFTRTVPAIISAITRFWQLKEGVHFWYGQPPAKLGIPSPIIKPKDWSHCITFANGFVWHMVSLAVHGSANGMTVNYIILDEAKFVSKPKLDAEIMPTLSGITHPLGHPGYTSENPYYKGTLFVSDAALTARDNWMDKEELKCDVPIEHGPFRQRMPRELQHELDHYASRCVYYNELLRGAKASNQSIHVVTAEKRAALQTIAHAIRDGVPPFDDLLGQGITPATIKELLRSRRLALEDAELLMNYRFLLTKEEHFEMTAIRQSEAYQRKINQLRCNTFAFYRASTLDNIDLLRVDYIAKMKRDLPPVVFAISILNMKKMHSSDGFYSKLDIDRLHGYDPAECPAVEHAYTKRIASTMIGGQRVSTDYESVDFDTLQHVKSCTLDGDVAPTLPLYISFDYNANINWVVTGQLRRDEEVGRDALMVLSSMFTKNDRKLRELVQDWSAYYAPHRQRNRVVTYFYDSTAKHRGYAIAGQQDFKDVVIEELRTQGWLVNAVDMGRPMEHRLKHKDINEALAGVASPYPRFNRENNESLIVAMENTAVRVGSRGFEKDKSKEKYVETETDPLELRTDGTDAFDQLFLGCKYYAVSTVRVSMPRIY